MKKRKTTLVGIALVALAVLIILASVFLPRLGAKRDMKERLEAAASPTVQYVAVLDPHHQNQGLLAGNGKEVLLQGEALQNVQRLLLQLSAQMRFSKTTKEMAAGIDLRITVKGADGSTTLLYFEKDRFYFIEGERVHYFTPKDTQAYEALLQALYAALQ